MPICVTDTDPNETFNLYKDVAIPTNKLATSTTPTADQYTGFSYNSTLQAYTTNYKQVFGTEDIGSDDVFKNFIITDHTGAESNAGQFTLTLLPATIGLTASTSVSNHDFSLSSSTTEHLYDYKDLKYGDRINVNCTNSTDSTFYHYNLTTQKFTNLTSTYLDTSN